MVKCCKANEVKLFIGEFGICRNIKGAEHFLMDIGSSCLQHKLIAFLYAYRERKWDGMDYELGTSTRPSRIRANVEQNVLMQTILELNRRFLSLNEDV